MQHEQSIYDMMNESEQKQQKVFNVLTSHSSNEDISHKYLMRYEFSVFFLVINLILLIPMFYFCKLLRLMVHRENAKKEVTFLDKVLLCFGYAMPISMVSWVCVVNGVFTFIYPTSETFGPWFCYIFEVTGHFIAVYLGVLSLIAAIMRYKHIVGNKKGKCVTTEAQKTKFLTIHVTIPTVVALLNALSNGDHDGSFWIRQCWGHHEEHSTLDPENKFISYLADISCYNRKYELEEYLGATAANAIEPILRFVCGGLSLFYMVYMANVVELILYVLIFRHVNR